MSFLLFAKIDKFYTRLVTLTSFVFFVLLSACVWFCLFCEFDFSFVWLLFAVGCLREEVGEDRFVKNVHCFCFFFSREKGRSIQSWREFAIVFLTFSFSREGTRLLLLLYREVPGGVAHCWRTMMNDLGWTVLGLFLLWLLLFGVSECFVLSVDVA